jgi:NAD(P)H dehydrogenase (quinone)
MIVVTGGSGQLGRAISHELLQTVGPNNFRLSVRDVAQARAFAQHGVDVRTGDFDRPDTLRHAFEGVSQLVLISTNGSDADRLRQHQVALDAARQAGVEHVVYTSYVPARQSRDLLHAAAHADTEAYVHDLGCAFTILRNNYYAEIFLMYAKHAVHTGVIPLPGGIGQAAMIARPDLVKAVVATLAPTFARNRTWELTGPSAHGLADLATVITNVTGRSVVYHDTDEVTAAQWLTDGEVVPPAYVPFVLQATQELAADVFASVSNDFEAIVGYPAQAAPAVWTHALRQPTSS